jgi:hypothetical protein
VPGELCPGKHMRQPVRVNPAAGGIGLTPPLGSAAGLPYGVYARATAAAVDQYLLALAAGSRMTTCRGLLVQRRCSEPSIAAATYGKLVFLAAIARPWTPVSGLSPVCPGRDGPWDLCLYLLCPRPDLMGTDLGRHSVRGAEERRSARHQAQRRPVDARERIGHYLDVPAGTAPVSQRTWVSRL